MQKWEYCFNTFADGFDRDILNGILNDMGLKGWELVTVTVLDSRQFSLLKDELTTTFYWKRPI